MAKGYRRRENKRMREGLFCAWCTAAWSRREYKLPKWEDIDRKFETQSKPASTKEQTPEEMLSTLRVLNAAYGGDVVEVYG